MANEYLKRQPTSTGSRRSFSISFWMKNSDPTQGYTAIIGAGKLSPSNIYNEIFYNNGAIGLNLDNAADPENYTVNVDQKNRDSSSWMHVLFVFDDSKSVESEKAIFYINGNRVAYSAGASTIVNEGTFFNNSDYIHYIGSRAQQEGGTNTFDGQFFDAFMVDGQTLTPDVFGYYKKGDGYISVGATQATDFKKGQWVPKAPKVIKSVINARGGFGVNGFYLPMNDNTNVGADLHCTPNSIIKLKGEDDPQPRNGAPATSDAYVSQLREDPYAANLVLAVPGIELENTNTELVTNGDFSNGTTSWTVYDDGTLSATGGILKVTSTNGINLGVANQVVTTVIGTRYTFSVDVIPGNTTGRLRVDDSDYWQGNYFNKSNSDYGTHTISFEATSTTTHISLSPNSPTNGDHCFFTNVSLKEEIPVRDYSADIKGSGSNKTITANGNATVATTASYYGSAMSFPGTYNHNIALGANSDFAFGTGDFTVEMWFYTNKTERQRILSSTQGGFIPTTWVLRLEPGNILTQYTANAISGVYVPPNQWHHVAVEREGTITSLYLNGVCVGTDKTDTKNYTEAGSNNFWLSSGYTAATDTENFDGQIQDLRVYKGVAKYKGGFDVPKPYTPVGIESWRAVPDTCQNNFATWNPLMISADGSDSTYNERTFSDGNLTVTSTGLNHGSSSNFQVSSGKWYWEFRLNNWFADNIWLGVIDHDFGGSGGAVATPKPVDSNYFPAGDNVELVLYGSSGSVYRGTSYDTGVGETIRAGDILGISLDLDTDGNKQPIVGFYKNGNLQYTSSGSMSGNPVGLWRPAVTFGGGATGWIVNANFGQNPTFSGNTTAGTYTDANGKGLFKYQPPSGFLALCEDNLPTPAIADPGKHFKTVLYTADDSDSMKITGVGFKPDLVWVKKRTGGSQNHTLYDSVRGADKRLMPNVTNEESSVTDYIRSFDNDGFSIGGNNFVNDVGQNYVAWCWKAGGNSNTFNVDGTGYATASAAGITDGSIALTGASVNTAAGFSIVSYTGTGSAGTVGHGLGKAPKFILIKRRSGTSNWGVAGSILGANSTLYLNLTNETDTYGDTNLIRNIQTSTTFELGTDTNRNELDGTHIAYCWAEIEGFSKFGSYTGNENADGPFVYCGFKPAWVMIKRTDVADSWAIFDSSRDSTNAVENLLRAEGTNSEATMTSLVSNPFGDLLSNGFKIRNTSTIDNTSGSTYIFAAFAESPFTTANAK